MQLRARLFSPEILQAGAVEGLRLVRERTVGPGTVKKKKVGRKEKNVTPCEAGLVLEILTSLPTTQGHLRTSPSESTRSSIRKERNAAPHP